MSKLSLLPNPNLNPILYPNPNTNPYPHPNPKTVGCVGYSGDMSTHRLLLRTKTYIFNDRKYKRRACE